MRGAQGRGVGGRLHEGEEVMQCPQVDTKQTIRNKRGSEVKLFGAF